MKKIKNIKKINARKLILVAYIIIATTQTLTVLAADDPITVVNTYQILYLG